MKKICLTFVLLGTLGAFTSHASIETTSHASAVFSVQKLTLAQAKDKGWVGERFDGYLGIVSDEATDECRDLVKQVNADRKAKYKSKAKKSDSSLKLVQSKAGKYNIKKTHKGHYVMLEEGAWTVKETEAE